MKEATRNRTRALRKGLVWFIGITSLAGVYPLTRFLVFEMAFDIKCEQAGCSWYDPFTGADRFDWVMAAFLSVLGLCVALILMAIIWPYRGTGTLSYSYSGSSSAMDISDPLNPLNPVGLTHPASPLNPNGLTNPASPLSPLNPNRPF